MFETFKQQKEGQCGWCETERQRGREREGKKILMSIRDVRQDWGAVLWKKQGLKFDAILNGILNIMRLEKLD